MPCPLHFRCLRLNVLTMLVSLALPVPSGAQNNTRPLFEQDLQSYGYRFQYAKGDHFQNFTDLAFLADNLLLVSVKELSLDELHPRVLPSGTLMYDNPMGARTSPSSLSTLLLFSTDEKRLLRSAKLPVRKTTGAVQATRNGHFLILSSFGLHDCSAELECGPPWPSDGPVYISPQGAKAVAGGSQFSEQQLVDTSSLSVLETFKERAPKVIPGDMGWLEVDQQTIVRMPGKKEVALSFAASHTFPDTRFLDRDTVIGVRMSTVAEGKATVVNVDGGVLYQIQVQDAWRGNTHFVSSAAGKRFCVAELYYTRLNSFINFFDIADSRAYNRARVRVFEVSTGRQVFALDWDPREYRGEDIQPALSPSGHRLALVRKGTLQVYDVP